MPITAMNDRSVERHGARLQLSQIKTVIGAEDNRSLQRTPLLKLPYVTRSKLRDYKSPREEMARWLRTLLSSGPTRSEKCAAGSRDPRNRRPSMS